MCPDAARAIVARDQGLSPLATHAGTRLVEALTRQVAKLGLARGRGGWVSLAGMWQRTGLMEQLGDVLHPIELRNGGGPDWGPRRIPKGKVLVMGDHRGNSLDGRIFGLVDEAAVRGKAKAVYLRDWDFGWRQL